MHRTWAWAIVLWSGVAWADEHDYLGAEACASACHPTAYESWRASPHANALAQLSETDQQDPVCRSCHTMVVDSARPELQGVQCESCHGAGRLYAPSYVMRDERLRELMGLAKIEPETCASCHRSDAPRVRPFNYAEALEAAAHGALTKKVPSS